MKSYSRTDLPHLRYLGRKHLGKVSLYSLKSLGIVNFRGIHGGNNVKAGNDLFRTCFSYYFIPWGTSKNKYSIYTSVLTPLAAFQGYHNYKVN